MQNNPGENSRQARIAFRPVTRNLLAAGKRSVGSYAIDALCFAIPAANFFSITLVGSVPGGEFLTTAAVIPCVLYASQRIWRGYNKTIFVLMGLWFLNQLVTDYYRHSPFGLMERGLAAIAFFAINLIVISALAHKSPRRILYLILGQITSYVVPLLPSALNLSGLDWKFGWAPIVIPVVLLVSSYFYSKRRYWVAFTLVIAIAAENLVQNYRSEMLILMIGSILILPLPSFIKGKDISALRLRTVPKFHAQRSQIPIRPLMLLLLTLLAGYGTTKAYSYFASEGVLGDKAQEKYLEQSRGKFGLLIGGRPETLISWRAVVDSPILGHGSWAEDPHYSEMLADLSAESGYVDDEARSNTAEEESYMIPLHSYIMSAWVWAGVLGAVFWAYVLFLTTRALLNLATDLPPLLPYFAYLLIGEYWSVLFSPFGHTVRMDQAIFLVIVCSLLDTASPRETLNAVASQGPGQHVGEPFRAASRW